ncbi:hypothetical protein AB0890_19120 [Streptomyces sp. NPDC005406]|uniref:hypothetical protein n=1 Tax=Streptomyces sp. NPDC005406 TaxID=3155339 RepID=UPI003455CC8B
MTGQPSPPGPASAIGRFDADITVIGPPELREAFAYLARRFTGAAADDAPTTGGAGSGEAPD